MAKAKGFTLVELLIVIVVIAILAAITIVAYNGVQDKANNTAVKSDLSSFAKQMELVKIKRGGTYPSGLGPAKSPSGQDESFTKDMGFSFTKGSYMPDVSKTKTLDYCYNPANGQYIMMARSKSGTYFYYISGENIKQSDDEISGWGVCSLIGLVQKNPSVYGLDGTTWADWVN